MIQEVANLPGGEPIEIPDIVHLEQHVNERLGSDPPPRVSAELLPEAGTWRPLAWARVQSDEIEILSDEARGWRSLAGVLDGGDGAVLFPVHPLVEKYYQPSALVRKGRFAVSASYRTVFFEPDSGCPLADLVPPGAVMMIKLHLDDPLPGIAGDRKLTPARVRKCIELSTKLTRLFSVDASGRRSANVVRERFGLIHGERGAIIRFVPRKGLVPVFALYSRESAPESGPPILVSLLEQLGWPPEAAAGMLADWLARPILSAVLAGFREGFSLEMHGQNTLLEFSKDGTIATVHFRDLESVVFFPELRERGGLAPIELGHLGPELFQNPRNPTRWFNRNIDHDVGRIFRWTLRVLEREGAFTRQQTRVSAQSIRTIARELISTYSLEDIARQGRWLPYSRTPYGSGLRRCHYYRTSFR